MIFKLNRVYAFFRTAFLAALVAAAVGACATPKPVLENIRRAPASDEKDKKLAEDARKAMQRASEARLGAPQAFTDAITQLKPHRYAEVVDLAFSFFSDEIAKPKPNTYILNALLSLISAHGGTSKQIKEFAELSKSAEKQLPQKLGGSWAYIWPEFGNTARAMASVGKPPSLPAPENFADWAVSKGYKSLAAGTNKCVSDEIRKSMQDGSWTAIIGRENETDAGLDVLVRLQGKVPVYVGEAGVGKTAAAESIAYRILMDDLPPGVHAADLRGSIVIETTSARIAKLAKSNDANAQAAAVEEYFAEVKNAEKTLGKPIIVFIDEAHTLSKAQLDALKPLLMNRDPIRMIWATTGREMGLNFSADEAIMRRIEPILLEEFSPELTAQILRKTWVPVLEKRYAITITDDVLRAAVEVAPHYRTDVRRPSGPFLLLQDFAISQNRLNGGTLNQPDEKMLLKYASKKSGLPVFPQDRGAFVAYMEKLKVELKAEVKGQGAMVDRLVDQFSSGLSRQGNRTHSTVMILGTTGVGKTMVAEKIGEKFYGSRNRVLEIDMTAYMDGGFSLNALFGAPSGVVSSDTSKGVLVEFLEGRGKGGGVIILNEIEKAHPDVLKRFMEVLDKGEVTGGDGKIRKLGRSLVVMTSNKGAAEFFPPDLMKGISRPELDRRIRSVDKSRLQEAFLRKESYASSAATPREVVQRVDEWILGSPLLRPEVLEIARGEADRYAAEFAKATKGSLKVSDAYVEKIVDAYFNEADGAREVNRRIRDYLDRAVNAFTLQHPSSIQLTIDAEAPALRPSEMKVIISDGKARVLVDGPKIALQNPMQDPEVRARLKGLEATLSAGIIDQEEAVKKVTNAIRASAAAPGNKSPASIFLAGRTGTGKTELAKRAAEARYGNSNAIKIINMGNVKNEYSLNDIFSPPKGIVGSDSMGPFEKALNDFPDGCVIVFDEMSNAGGNDKALKEEIAKRFYSILDEGVWSSPSREYRNLNKFTFIFTGNDGEQLFRGLEDDDLLLAAWKQMAGDRTRLKSMLLESGFPEAFIGRIKDQVLMKPPSFEAKVRVAHKMLEEWKAKFASAQPFEIVFEKDLDRKLARLMYSSGEGARSVRNFIDTTLGSFAAQSVYDFDWDQLAHTPGKITIGVESTSVLSPFYWLRPTERKALLKIEAKQGGKVVYSGTADFTNDAKFMKQIRVVDAWGTAFHEAGHAVLNNPKISGQTLEHLTIVPSGGHLGYAR